MAIFTYENQGAETMLVYQMGEEEHLDQFAKGMLQSNEMNGMIRPSFIQRDLEQYLKFPVTSKIPLKDFLQGTMEKSTVLELCLSIAGAVHEAEEYMLSAEKMVLDQEYIFVDIRKKSAALLYLPVDEFQQEMTVKEFLLHLLSHMRYRMDEDVSYVAKLIHFLNRPEVWEFEELERYIQNLPDEREMEPQDMFRQPFAGQQAAGVLMDSSAEAEKPVPVFVPPVNLEPGFAPGADSFNPIAQDLDKPVKKGLFSNKGKKKEKAALPDSRKKGVVPDIVIPGIEVPGAGGSVIKREPEVVLNVDEKGKYLADQKPLENKKKPGLFSFGKKKTFGGNLPGDGMPADSVPPGRSAMPFSISAGQAPMPSPFPAGGVPVGGNTSACTGYGSSDDKNQTVIIGGKDYGATVILNGQGERRENVSHHVVKVIRRRNGQSMVMNKDLLRIGSEGSFVDFFIGDNPAIGSCHADIYEDGGSYFITDRNSVNHTYVDGEMAPPMQGVPLHNGAMIRLADEDFEFIIS